MPSVRSLLVRTTLVSGIASVILGAGVFVGMRLAQADPGGPTRDALTFSGTLRSPSGAPITSPVTSAFTFVFRKGAGANPPEFCRSVTTPITVPAGGAFAVPIPIDRARCPRSLFDGGDVSYDVLLGSEVIASNVPVTVVPYARFADQSGVHNDCPAGYTLDGTTGPGTVCARTVMLGSTAIRDELVKVGAGVGAFWVDRFEASVYDRSGVLLGTGGSAVFPGLPRNGQWAPALTQPPLLALSRAAVLPSGSMTWFQANELCRASGKRLPTGEEWLAAASGTIDSATNCWIDPSNTTERVTSATGACRSAWGAHDMIGNVWEWTADWYASAGSGATMFSPNVQNWPADYRGDLVSNVGGFVHNGVGPVAGLPAAAIRGGNRADATLAGVFSLNLGTAASGWSSTLGFRCVVDR